MRVLTVRPPWAQAIIFGGKDVENRSTNISGSRRPYRGPVAIHVGMRFDTDSWNHPGLARWMREYWGMTRENFTGDSFRGGAIVGVVDLWSVHDLSEEAHGADEDSPPRNCSEWAHWSNGTRWHLMLRNPRALAEPIPYRGALGLRTLDEATTARVLEAIA